MKLSDREILYIVERGKIIPADREVSMNNEVLQGILTELQTLREIVAVIDSFVKVGEKDYCYITTPNCGCMWCRLIPLLKKRDEL